MSAAVNSNDPQVLQSRRQFWQHSMSVVGSAAYLTLGRESAHGASHPTGHAAVPHTPAAAKRIIYLTQAGAPSQLDLWDYKPNLRQRADTDLPESVRNGQRLTGMTSQQARFPVAPSPFAFQRCGQSGIWVSEVCPYLAGEVDHLCVIKSLHTEAINHDPAMTLLQTGHQFTGRPSFGAWVAYGLGSENHNLPSFVVLISRPGGPTNAQPLHERMWGAGFLPSKFQGVRLSPGRDPVLYLSDPPGYGRERRRKMLDVVEQLNQNHYTQTRDPEILSRIEQYEMAFRMQATVPELADFSSETSHSLARYGTEVHKPGTYAANCLLARRLAERGVRFIQLYHRGWDQHADLPAGIRSQCRDTDQPTAALLADLRERGLLDDTLVVWAGEFGRTVYAQGSLAANFGRDHHPRCYSGWIAGAGIQGGQVIGETDDFSYNITHDPVHLHDLNATLMHLLGIEHTRLTYRHVGRDYRLTDLHGQVVAKALKQAAS